VIWRPRGQPCAPSNHADPPLLRGVTISGPSFRLSGTPGPTSVLSLAGARTEDVMRHPCIAIAASAVLIAVEMPGLAGAAGVSPTSLGFEPLPYGAPHGYGPQPAYGPTPPYAPAPHSYGLARRRAPPPQHPPQHAFRASPVYGPGTEYAPSPFGYGPPSYADGLPPSYGSNPEYDGPPHSYDRAPYAMSHDPNARLRAWNEISDTFTEALRQIRSARHSEFASRSATRPR